MSRLRTTVGTRTREAVSSKASTRMAATTAKTFLITCASQQIVVAPTLKIASIPQETAAPLPPPTPVEVTEDVYQVDPREPGVPLLKKPRINKRNRAANVIAQLPAGK